MEPSARLTAEQCLAHPWLEKEYGEHHKLKSQMSGSFKLADGRQGSFQENSGAAIVTSLKQFGTYGKLKKAALMVVAHRAESSQVGLACVCKREGTSRAGGGKG